MAFWKVFALCLLGLSQSHGAGSPHGEEVSHMFAPTSNYAVDVLEDARLDAFSLIRKYGYPAEIHRVTTEDGYVLEMHRIRHGRNQNNDPSVERPVVFLMHGILSSSADWINMGPNQGFGYILAEEGYDVWMGNARGNFYSRSHSSLNPDGLFNRRFWDFSWHEIGNIDLPTMIDYVLQETSKDSLHYIGHSQGTTSFFVMASTKPEYNAKIKSMHALAPIAFFEHVTSLLLKALAPFSGPLATITTVLGLGEFLPNNEIMTWAGIALCYEETTITNLCGNILVLLGGINEKQVNQTMIPVKLGHTPAGASNRQFAHFGQGINDGRFRQYDHGIVQNLITYGSISPPDYDLSLITAPVALHYSLNDNLAHERDVLRLFRELGNPLGLFLVPLPEFTHLDFMWAIDVRSLVYDRVINLMRAFE